MVNFGTSYVDPDTYHPRAYGWVPENEFKEVFTHFLTFTKLAI
jgi:hypothetical protein